MKNSVDPKHEILLAVGLIVFSIVFYVGSADLPPPRYEPLGSAALPQGLAAIMVLLSVILVVRALPRLKTFKAEENEVTDVTPRPVLAAIIFVLTILFVAVMDLGLLSFVPAGIIYLTAVGYFLSHRDLKKLPWFLAYAVILVVGNFYIFTKLFYIDLP